MTTSAIRKQLHSYLDVADDKKVKAIYTILEDDIAASNAEGGNHWADPAFVAEMDRRVKEYESNKAKVFTLEEMKANARSAFKQKGK